ncbi:hypothetical protein NUSPORA_00931 [Nucleospora cyclopteri]
MPFLNCTFTDCNKKFSCKSKLNDHLNAHWNIKPYKCSICNNSYCSLKAMKVHERTHTSCRFTCEKCKRSFLHKNTLKNHTCEIVYYQCSRCKKKFIKQKNYQNHIENKHKNPERIKKRPETYCIICKKDFASSKTLKTHQKSIHSNIKHECNKCKRTFSFLSNLIRHKKKCK